MEKYKSIPNLNNYEINEYGEVRNQKTGRILKQKINKDTKRICINLPIEKGKPKSFNIHRLVALTYIPNINNLPAVDHIDRNIYNNHVSNLRWVENKVNMQNKITNKNCLYYDELCDVFIVQCPKQIKNFKYHNLEDALNHFKKLLSIN
jgi:hypothetical protein